MRKVNGALTEVVQEIRDSASKGDGDRVDVGSLLEALDERGYGALLSVLPLIELSPLGGIPGFPTALAITIGIITARLLLGYEHLWAPGFVRNRTLKSEKVVKAMDWLQPVSQRVDGKLHERLAPLTGPVAERAACVVILCLLPTVPPLEVIPFGTSAPMLAIAVFGLALLFKDGLLMLFGFIGAAAAAGLAVWSLLGGSG